MNMEEISKEWFNDVKIKYLKEITYVTPKGNNVKAVINKASNRHMGSMYIYEVNGKPAIQYVRSMPKIHYYDDRHNLKNDEVHFAYEKKDGSCIIVYALKDHDGNIIEVVPKSRNMPILDANLQMMYDDIDTLAIKRYIEATGHTVFFELHGVRNKHMITEMDTYCRLTLIGEVVYDIRRDGTLLVDIPFDEGLLKYAQKPLVIIGHNRDGTFYVEFGDLTIKYYPYVEEDFKDDIPTLYDALMYVKKLMDGLNESYKKENGRVAIEGLVFNSVNPEDEQIYIKLKPTEIEEDARSENGIPKTAIRKECYKFLDEYGSEAKEIYLNNPQKIWNYINHMLKEEYSDIWVDKSQRKIKNTFCEVMDNREVPESIQNICQRLIKEYPKEDITGLMRIFAQEYPFKKKNSGIVYHQLSLML